MRIYSSIYVDICVKIILEQLNRPEERRCPVAKVSNEIVELLCEYWEIFAPGCMLACLCSDLTIFVGLIDLNLFFA